MPEASFTRLHIRKEALKFSAAHMTVFANGTKEALHGHNYRTELTVEFLAGATNQLLAFSTFKAPMKAICQQWDEKVLLAGQCPHFKILEESQREIEFSLCDRRYVLPRDEVEILPVDNIVTENLAREFSRRLVGALRPEDLKLFSQVEIKVEEMTGQGAAYVWQPGAG